MLLERSTEQSNDGRGYRWNRGSALIGILFDKISHDASYLFRIIGLRGQVFDLPRKSDWIDGRHVSLFRWGLPVGEA